MSIKWIGAILILTASCGFGLHIASGYRVTVQTLNNMVRTLDYMECALQYQLTPLPLLCEQAGKSVCGKVRRIYMVLSAELRAETHEDANAAMTKALMKQTDLSVREKQLFCLLGNSLGCFDLPGQIKGLQQIRDLCMEELTKMKANQELRLRNYQTLGLCAGAALVILFI